MFISVNSIAPRNERHKAGFGCSDDLNLGYVMTKIFIETCRLLTRAVRTHQVNAEIQKRAILILTDYTPTGIDNFGTSDSGTPGSTNTI